VRGEHVEHQLAGSAEHPVGLAVPMPVIVAVPPILPVILLVILLVARPGSRVCVPLIVAHGATVA